MLTTSLAISTNTGVG
ncbi:hypothetical protein HU200_033173 [Digitaria exilis]|uniref:Uncharacterized protein n=1 Tax=Digitaria exilis TaxID=1010633 RepID=A0A835BLL0_9POAL|nr:hypothetical protein HU200_033173 [Digitaria exilis]